ncbi:serine protease Do [Amaricoccus macauensis]|uniref:Probable periplasmic serine endoprotease DegP-like n=1 Tax=Amaricoccus macauensis TaxID=57001 RepID=A0A840SJG8_9RHOB|nr:Do family serine endopeptidase [Amaricoccus macauensis]MBB5222057.1 serine protease Do [Amaricoccus macauensis]
MTRRATFTHSIPVTATAIAAASAAWIAWTPVATADTEAPNAVADLVERVSPAVVTVLATQDDQRAANDNGGRMRGPQGQSPFGEGSPFDEFLRRFGLPDGPGMPGPFGQNNGPQQPDRPQGVALGSGFVIEGDGLIVTNNHVVDHAESVKVRLSDDREFDAKVMGTDEQTDLALLKIDAKDLPELALGDSDAVRVGEDVIAVGNPFGLGGTVTRGIVSALARDISAGPYVDFIQTDAAINHGNSGGPLLNLEGEVIGVNSAIYSPNGGSVGVGFAIPSNTVKTVIAQLEDKGSVERGWLGVSIQNVTPEIAAAIGMKDEKGALVSEVIAAGPSNGVLKNGDVILSFDGKPVDSSRELPKLVAAAAPDATVKIDVLRQGKEETLSLKLGRFDNTKVASAESDQQPQASAASDKLGVTLEAITPTAREQLGLGDDVDGVVITSLDGTGHAANAGLAVGDVILQIGSTEVRSPSDVDRAIADSKSDAVLLQIERRGAKIFVGVKLA